MPLPTQRSPTEPDRMVSGPSIPSSRESTEHSAAREQGTYPDDEVFYREHNTKRPARQTLEADIPRTKEEIKKQIRDVVCEIVASEPATTSSRDPVYEPTSTREGSRTVAQVLNMHTKRARWEAAAESELEAYESLLRILSLQRKTMG